MARAAVEQPELSFGKYHIVRPLKVGGTAAIYLAVLRGENNFSREVVIKRPLPHLVSDARARLMFIDEAHIASRLSHPNICQVLDLVARADELYLVLEYLKGLDLREVLKRTIELGRLVPPEVAVWIAIEVAAGLDFAHEARAIDGTQLNLVHRDVSPKNIRVTDSGSVKVIDFGIARAVNRATETAVGTIKGTLGYMSPEQIMGDEIDRRSDIFAFGIVLFQMLTLRNPFDGPTLKERVRLLTQAPIPPMRQFLATLDDEIEAIVARCLERDVEARYQRMRDVQRDLERYLAHLQASSPRQRLIQFLEELFPTLHEADHELKQVLTEISSVTGRIDVTQRLLFPDDEDATQQPVATMPTTKAATVATERDAAFAVTKTARFLGADETEPREVGSDTRRLPRGAEVQDPSERATAHGSGGRSSPEPGTARSTPAVDDRTALLPPTAEPRTRLWPALILVLAAVAGVVAGVTYWLSERWSTASIVEDAGREVAPTVAQVAVQTSTRAAVRPAADAGAEGAAARAVVTASPDAGLALTKGEPRDAGRPVKDAPVREVAVVDRAAAPGASDRAEARGSADRARLYFKTALRLDRLGRTDDALLMYTLAYEESGKRVDPAILRNLGLFHNRAGDAAKARACLRGYLDASPEAPDAERIRTLVSSFPAGKVVPCVDLAELARARKTAARNGSMIAGWVDETVAERLR